MIPQLPDSVNWDDRLEFYSTIAGNLSDQSSIHVNWHTHRQNPSTCWICDQNILISKVLAIATYLSKSALDMVTEYSSENESDAEIEDGDSEKESLNCNEEPEVTEDG